MTRAVQSRQPAKSLVALTLAMACLFTVGPVSRTATGRVSPLPESSVQWSLGTRAGELPRLRSVLVSVGGELVEERYFRGASRQRPENLKSVSKSIISLLVGIAIDHRYLAGVDQPIAGFFPRFFAATKDAQKAAITIEDLLTMRSGLETTSNRNYGRWVQSPNWVWHVLSRPFVDRPGGRMVYSTGSSHLLSAILTRATGMSTLAFGRQYLAMPLGIDLPAWQQDPQGIYFGGNEMQLTPPAMLKIGQLYLRSGTLDGREVVSERWVRASLNPRTRSRFSGRQYGYGWWTRSLGGHLVQYAWGYGGQFIFVVPELDLVAVMTSTPTPGDGRREHLRALYGMMEDEIIPAAERRRTGARPPV